MIGSNPCIQGLDSRKSMYTTDNQGELFYWVDEKDQELGCITRREAHSGSLKIHRGVWILVYSGTGELFLQKRSLTKDNNPGLWSLSVGGHATYGQTYKIAAAREMKEELGIDVVKLQFLHKYQFRGKRETEISSVYKTIHNGPFVLNKQEIDTGNFFPLSVICEKVRSGEIKIANWALATIQVECGILPERPEMKECIIQVFETEGATT